MVGDSAVADIGGAYRLGLRSAWVRRSRTWPVADAPTLAAETGPEAIRAILRLPVGGGPSAHAAE